MNKGDPCVIAWADGSTTDATFWDDLDGHTDVIADDRTWCILPNHGTILTPADAALLLSQRKIVRGQAV